MTFASADGSTVRRYRIDEVAIPYRREARAHHYRPLQARVDQASQAIALRVSSALSVSGPTHVSVRIHDADGRRERHLGALDTTTPTTRRVGFSPPLRYAHVAADQPGIPTQHIVVVASDDHPAFDCDHSRR